MTALALGGLVVHARDDGLVQVGAAAMPAWMAADLAVRLWEATGSVPEAQQARLRAREHLDALGRWEPCTYRNVETKQTAKGMLLRLSPLLGHLRVSDTVTCLVRQEGELYARGCGLCVWRIDSLTGATFDHVELTTRLSVRWARKQIGGVG